MKKTNELKNELTAVFSNRANWNRFVEVGGEMYAYNSSKNEIRKLVEQPSGTIAILIGCFACGRFMWCC